MDGETVIRTETQAPLLVGVAIGFVVASAVVLALRLYTRVWLIQTPGADDWTIVLAMVRQTASLANGDERTLRKLTDVRLFPLS